MARPNFSKAYILQIMIDRSLRAQPFTDSILREMAINFPKGKMERSMTGTNSLCADQTELLQIPDIDPDKVERYGKRFLKLIRNAENFYENMMRANEDRPEDPNHRNVINISSDEEGDGESFDEFDESMASQEERSTYFQSPPEVDAFNAQCKLAVGFLHLLFLTQTLSLQFRKSKLYLLAATRGRKRHQGRRAIVVVHAEDTVLAVLHGVPSAVALSRAFARGPAGLQKRRVP